MKLSIVQEELMETKNIGSFIQQIRKEKKLTQKQLADLINVSDKTISKWENGNSLPDTSILLLLCDALGISINELLSCQLISPEDYSKKAEENIMFLIEENQNARRRKCWFIILGLVLIVLALVLIAFTLAGFSFPINNYFDLPSMLFLVMIEAGLVFISGVRTREKVLRLISKTILPVGACVSLVAGIIVLGYLVSWENIEIIGPNMAVSFLSFLYALIVKIVVETRLVVLHKEKA